MAAIDMKIFILLLASGSLCFAQATSHQRPKWLLICWAEFSAAWKSRGQRLPACSEYGRDDCHFRKKSHSNSQRYKAVQPRSHNRRGATVCKLRIDSPGLVLAKVWRGSHKRPASIQQWWWYLPRWPWRATSVAAEYGRDDLPIVVPGLPRTCRWRNRSAGNSEDRCDDRSNHSLSTGRRKSLGRLPKRESNQPQLGCVRRSG